MKGQSQEHLFFAVDDFVKKMEHKGYEFDEILEVIAEYLAVAEEYL